MRHDVIKKSERLVEELKQLFEERLISVCVYGSSLFEEESSQIKDKHRNINVLVVLKSLALSDLEKASSVGKWWEKTGHTLPMFISEEEWQRSSDVFALEYADIRDNHHLAYGKDLFSSVKTDKDALRLICEMELHRKLIFLRQRLLLHRDQPQILLDLLQSTVNSFAAIFRGILRLKPNCNEVPQQPSLVFKALKDIIPSYDDTPFIQVLQSKESGCSTRYTDVFSLFCRYVQQISIVTTFVDEYYGFVVSRKEGVLS